MNLKKKILSIASAAALTATGLLGTSAMFAGADEALITNGGPYTGDAYYIATYMRDSYYQQSAFEISFKYNSVGTPTASDENLGFNDTFEFLIFDSSWGGWTKTTVGPNGYDKTADVTPTEGTVYTVTVPISTIESKLATGGTPYGINLQTGGIGTSNVSIVSLRYISGTYTQQEFTATGNWVKGTYSSMTVSPANAATVSPNEYNIGISSIDLSAWTNPTVDVTVTYSAAQSYVQAEILRPTGETDSDGNPVYEAVDPNYVSPAAGTYTYTTELPAATTSFIVCYDQCTVTSISVYDNTQGNITTSVTGKTASEVASQMQPCWNLGCALESVDGNSSSSTYGQVGEKFWGTPKTTKKLIQAVKDAGFKSIRIPVSFMNKINSDNTVDDDYLARIKQVIDYAYDMGMYVVIDMHNDGGYGVHNMWLDITKTGSEFTAVKAKFAAVWSDIATYFASYDQRLVFEGFNELMNGSYSSAPTAEQYANVNALNTAFVSAVRSAGGSNTDRVLIVAGYNTNIDYTIAGFTKPADSTANRLMLSVHYYDPYDFALNEYGTGDWGTDAEIAAIQNAVNSIANFAAGKNMPVFIGEYGPVIKTASGNAEARQLYCYWLNYYAASCTNTKVITAYWDNGFTTTNGSGLFDRINNEMVPAAEGIINAIIIGTDLEEF